MGKRERIKVLVSVIGLDGHSIGAEVVCRILMDAGMEVVYLGIYQTPEMIVQAAIQEDVDVIGISSHASNYDQIVELLGLLKKNNLDDIAVICGGTIPKHQMQELKKKGVSEIFPPKVLQNPLSIISFQGVKNSSFRIRAIRDKAQCCSLGQPEPDVEATRCHSGQSRSNVVRLPGIQSFRPLLAPGFRRGDGMGKRIFLK